MLPNNPVTAYDKIHSPAGSLALPPLLGLQRRE